MADPIDPLPTPPNRGMQDREEFVVVTDAFLASLPNFVTQVNAFSADLNNRITLAFTGTFSTSLTIGTGAKSFTGALNMALSPGQTVVVASTASPANSMTGTVTSYDKTTGSTVLSITSVSGSGTFSAWSIGLMVSANLAGYVTLTGTETLTNKTLTTPVLSATASGTTAGRLGYSAGVFTFGDGTTQQTVVSLAQSQTLTNKTLTAPVIATIVNTGTLTLPASTDTLVGRATTDTMTNKRITKRVVAAGATSGTLTPNGNTTDTFKATGLTGAVTIAVPSGTPTDQQQLILYFKDNGTSRAFTWTIDAGGYRVESGVTLPTATTISKHVRVACIYNSDDGFWDVVSVVAQA